jgi:hypothetical protein
MSTGSWQNNDGLFLEFGTQKSNPELAGDYMSYGQTRMMEVYTDLTSLGVSSQILSTNAIFPTGYNVFIEKVEVVADLAATGASTFSIGLGYIGTSPTYTTITTNVESSTSSGITTTAYSAYMPLPTTISDTAFVNALTTTSMSTAGQFTTLTAGGTSAGTYLGSTATATTEAYITGKVSGTFSTGSARVRIFYRGYGTIFN